MKKILLFFCGWLISNFGFSQKCDTSKTPIVFVHGFLGSGDTYATQFQRFMANGYCNNQLYAFDWNSIGPRGNTIVQLDSFINVVIKKSGADKINLVGHSAGGGIGYSYLNDSLRALKVAHYVHIGSGKNAKPAGKRGEVPTMNIFSTDDKVAKGGEIPGAINVRQTQNDHYQVATSEATFYSMYTFFNIGNNASLTNKKNRKPVIAGKACLMGENTALAGASIDVYVVDLKKGIRKKSAPDFHFLADSLGNWGPFIANPADGYEFVLQPTGGQRTVHYFYEPFLKSNPLVYLRGLSTTGMTALLLNSLPSDDQQAVLAIFTSNGAVVHGRDSLTINDINLSSAIISPAAKTGIAQFIFDDGDKKSSGKLIPNFNAVPFMNGVDLLLETQNNAPIHLYFNGRDVYLPKRKSASEGVMVLVLN